MTKEQEWALLFFAGLAILMPKEKQQMSKLTDLRDRVRYWVHDNIELNADGSKKYNTHSDQPKQSSRNSDSLAMLELYNDTDALQARAFRIPSLFINEFEHLDFNKADIKKFLNASDADFADVVLGTDLKSIPEWSDNIEHRRSIYPIVKAYLVLIGEASWEIRGSKIKECNYRIQKFNSLPEDGTWTFIGGGKYMHNEPLSDKELFENAEVDYRFTPNPLAYINGNMSIFVDGTPIFSRKLISDALFEYVNMSVKEWGVWKPNLVADRFSPVFNKQYYEEI